MMLEEGERERGRGGLKEDMIPCDCESFVFLVFSHSPPITPRLVFIKKKSYEALESSRQLRQGSACKDHPQTRLQKQIPGPSKKR